MKGIITTIQRMSLHDGPGIRSTIFLKGCNFRCKWCHNPETYSPKPELEFIKQKCIACEECINVDDQSPMSKVEESITFVKNSITDSKKYSDICYSEALHTIGEEVTAEEVYNRVKHDIPYFRNSGGGITISGGEPLLQSQFCVELLKLFNTHSIHTAIETNLSLAWSIFEDIILYVDLIFVDLKSMNNVKHKNWIGKENLTVLDNLVMLDRSKNKYVIRTPIIPDFNNDEESIKSICEFVTGLRNLEYFELLPYHPLADSKYENLGIENPMEGKSEISQKEIKKLYEIINEYGIPTKRN